MNFCPVLRPVPDKNMPLKIPGVRTTLRLSGLYLLKCGHRPEKLLLPVFLTANLHENCKFITLQK